MNLKKQTWETEKKVQELAEMFIEKGYKQAAKYLLNTKNNLFSYIRTWLKTGLVNPRVSSQIERMIREIGRRIKKIGHGWSPKGAAKMTRIIIKRITSSNEWESNCAKKLKITGEIKISLLGFQMAK